MGLTNSRRSLRLRYSKLNTNPTNNPTSLCIQNRKERELVMAVQYNIIKI